MRALALAALIVGACGAPATSSAPAPQAAEVAAADGTAEVSMEVRELI